MSPWKRSAIYYPVSLGLPLAITAFFVFVVRARTWQELVLSVGCEMLAFVVFYAALNLTGFYRWYVHGFWLPGWRPCVCLDGYRRSTCTARTHRMEGPSEALHWKGDDS